MSKIRFALGIFDRYAARIIGFSLIVLLTNVFAVGCRDGEKTKRGQQIQFAIASLEDRVQDIEYIHFGGISPAEGHIINRDEYTAELLAHLRPIDAMRREDYKRIIAELKTITDFSKPFGPVLITATFDNVDLKKDIPKDVIFFEWLEAVPPDESAVRGFFIRSSTEEVSFPNSIRVVDRANSGPITPYESCEVCFGKAGVTYSDLSAMLKDNPRTFSTLANDEFLDRIRKQKNAGFEVGFILEDGSRTKSLLLGNAVKD